MRDFSSRHFRGAANGTGHRPDAKAASGRNDEKKD
jgi:hypothetical protein